MPGTAGTPRNHVCDRIRPSGRFARSDAAMSLWPGGAGRPRLRPSSMTAIQCPWRAAPRVPSLSYAAALLGADYDADTMDYRRRRAKLDREMLAHIRSLMPACTRLVAAMHTNSGHNISFHPWRAHITSVLWLLRRGASIAPELKSAADDTDERLAGLWRRRPYNDLRTTVGEQHLSYHQPASHGQQVCD